MTRPQPTVAAQGAPYNGAPRSYLHSINSTNGDTTPAVETFTSVEVATTPQGHAPRPMETTRVITNPRMKVLTEKQAGRSEYVIEAATIDHQCQARYGADRCTLDYRHDGLHVDMPQGFAWSNEDAEWFRTEMERGIEE